MPLSAWTSTCRTICIPSSIATACFESNFILAKDYESHCSWHSITGTQRPLPAPYEASRHPASFSHPAVWCGQVQLDYSSLRREHKAVGEGKERDKLAAHFQADMDERSALLAKLAPNLKAVEQYEAVKVSLYSQLGHTGRQ